LNLDKIPKTTRILDLVAMPVFFEGNEHGVLMLHGFTGTPCELYYLGEKLNKEGSYLELKYKCENVSVIGLSMGALLSILLASKFDIQKLVLAAPALKIYDWRVKLTPFFSPFLSYIAKNNSPEYDYEGLNRIASEYWNKIWIKPAAHFYRIQRMVKKRLGDLRSEILLILSRNDRTVPISVLEIFKSNIPGERLKTLILEKSSHVVTSDVEKELVAITVINWLKNNP